MDVQKDASAVAPVAHELHAAVSSLGAMGTRQCDMDQRIRTMQSKSTPLVFVYAAGPCGYGLSRSLTKTGRAWWVVAPSLLPKKAGDRVTTHRRDAIPWARLRRSGARTPVSGPQVADAASRDLRRAREDARRALTPATHRRQAFLRRHDSREAGQATWGPAPLRWRSEVVCPTPAQHIVFQAYVRAVTAQSEGLRRLAQELQAGVPTWRLRPGVDALQALRGVPVTVAVTSVAALGDLTRVDQPSQLLRDLGLTPAEYATGDHRPQGASTTTGNAHARRALIEGAWAARYPAKVSRHLQWRVAKVPTALQEIRGQAQVRLCQRSRQGSARGTHAKRVGVAIARELSAFLWALAPQVPVTPSPPRISALSSERKTVVPLHGQRRSPGVVHPSAAL